MNTIRIWQTDERLPEEVKQEIRKKFRGSHVMFLVREMQYKRAWFRLRRDKGLQLFDEHEFEPELLTEARVQGVDLTYEELLREVGLSEQEVESYTRVKEVVSLQGKKTSTKVSNLGTVRIVNLAEL